jgi:glycosyltransferase involved in cell wall biosynthesis
MSEKTVLVVDTLHSAMGISAQQHSTSRNVKVLAALDYSSPSKFIKALFLEDPQVIIFNWRRLLLDLLSEYNSRGVILRLRQKSQIYFVIADHLGLDPDYFNQEMALFDFANGYFVTNRILEHDYSKIFPNNPPKGIFRDLPNLNNIAIVQSESIRRLPNKIIWVGNSKWGNHYGYRDHKGLAGIVLPLIQKLERANPTYIIKIIDSASGHVDNLSVLREIASSRMLIQTSNSEGTGLPILEALALGTIPITNKVGIAEEILTGSLSDFVINNEVDHYFNKIIEVAHKQPNQEELLKVFNKYLHHSSIPDLIEVEEKVTPLQKFRLWKHLIVLLFWKIRFIRNYLRHHVLSKILEKES